MDNFNWNQIVQANPFQYQGLMQQAGLWDGFTSATAPGGANRGYTDAPVTDWGRLAGYEFGYSPSAGGQYTQALRDPSGNIVSTQNVQEDNLGWGDVLRGAAVLAGGYFGANALFGDALAAGAAGAASGVPESISLAQAGAEALPEGFSFLPAGAQSIEAAGAAGAAGGASGLGSLESIGTFSMPELGGALPQTVGTPSGGGLFGTGITASNLMSGAQLGSSLLGLYQGNQMLRQAGNADPFGPYRGQFAQQLAQLMGNPSMVTQLPGYQANMDAAQQALTRSLASQGLTGSGTAAEALTRFGAEYQQNAFNNYFNQLSGLSGATTNNASGAIAGQLAGYSAINTNLNNFFKVLPTILKGFGG